MASADSNIILRLLVEDDDAQYRAALAFLRAAGRVFISHIALAEVVWALVGVYGFTRPRIAAAIERLLDIDELALEDDEVVRRALIDYRSSTADFSDCLILSIARSHNELPLATFDAKLSRLEGARKIGGRKR